jgi:hypothetical protein
MATLLRMNVRMVSVNGLKEMIEKHSGVMVCNEDGEYYEDEDLINIDNLLELIDDLELRELKI